MKILNITKMFNTGKIEWNKLHIYFFYLFLFSIPFQTRKVFLTEYSFYSGAFTEYATFFIYASDLFLILALLLWLAFNKRERIKSRKIQLFLLAFIAWLVINTVIHSDYWKISAFQIIKFIELFLLLAYVYFNLANKKMLLTSLFVISLTGFLQGIIAIYQFIFQQSLFNLPILAKITGETTIGPQIPGIAKIVIDGEKLIRAYGTFPHSNILGSFLIFSILISVYLLSEHKYAILSRYKLNYAQFYNIKLSKSQMKTIVSLIWIIIIFTQITALLFTFSRSAWAGFATSILVLAFLLYFKRFNIVSRETMSQSKKNNIGKIDYNLNNVSRETLFTKIINLKNKIIVKLSKNVSRETILDEIKNDTKKYISDNVSRETFLNFKTKLNCYLLTIFISFLFIGLFDHYFWTLQQGRLAFWLILGMLLIDMRFKTENI